MSNAYQENIDVIIPDVIHSLRSVANELEEQVNGADKIVVNYLSVVLLTHAAEMLGKCVAQEDSE